MKLINCTFSFSGKVLIQEKRRLHKWVHSVGCSQTEIIRKPSGSVRLDISFPDGSVHGTDGGYDGYGHFGPGDTYDVYDMVADWNRKPLSQQPEYLVPQHGKNWDEEKKAWVARQGKKLSEFPWWPYYSDLAMSPEQITAKMHEMAGNNVWEYRWIGIDIACYDDQNAKLPFPIKIASNLDARYEQLPPSKGDPEQGF